MAASFRDIGLFVAAYEERSFTAAAERENATQSGVSQHVAKLERQFGVRLFTREKGRVTPTSAGGIYYARCLDILRAEAAAGAAFTDLSGGISGEVSVGLMPTMTRAVLAPALDRFLARQPNVAVRVVEAYSGVLTQQVGSGVFDFAIVPAFAGMPGLTIRPFLSTHEVLVTRRGRKRVDRSPVRLADLGPLNLVLPGPTNTRRQTLTTYCATHGVRIGRTIELDAMMGTLDLVARSNWVTLLPGVMMASPEENKVFHVRPLADPALTLDLVAIEPSRRTLQPAAAAFFAVLAEEARRLNAIWAPAERRGESTSAKNPRLLGRLRRTGRTAALRR